MQRRPIEGFPAYLVDDEGRVWSRWRAAGRGPHVVASDVQRQLVPVPIRGGYAAVTLRNSDGAERRVGVHTLVLEAFVGPCPQGCEARHLNGVADDNALRNLAWGTPLVNAADRDAHGTTARGERHGCAKLSDSQVLTIRSDSRPRRVIAAAYEVSYETVWLIQSGRSWKHLQPQGEPQCS